MLIIIGERIHKANGTNRFTISNKPIMISNVFSKISKYSNSNKAIASGLVIINGSS